MSAAGSIAKVALVGGGITAWSAAAALKRRIPSLDVQLISTPPPPDAIADRIISTLPSIAGFHHDIGLTDSDTVVRAGSGLRLGTLIKGWTDKEPEYVHAYGPCGTSLGGVAFHQLWLRHYQALGLPPFDRFSSTAEMARAGVQSRSGSETMPYGLQLTLARYGEMMRAYGLHLGVSEHCRPIADVVLRTDDGFIDRVELADGTAVAADLFIDCTGPSSLLHKRMGTPQIDWSSWLPCDRIAMIEGEAEPDAILMDSITALPFGWSWKASSPRAASIGIVYSSAHVDGDEAVQKLGDAHPLPIRQGRKGDFWVRNCVAIGDAAVVVEPLEWTNLQLVHSQLDRLISMMPGRDCNPVELEQFNRECGAEADRVRDFLCMHYICSARSEPFWSTASKIVPPESLQHTLSLFKERGRLPYYQEETFSRDSWLTVLLGQGVRPRRIDPLAELVPAEEAAQAFSVMHRSLQGFTLPAGSPLLELSPLGIR